MHELSTGNLNIKLDLCNYLTKFHLKRVTGIDTTTLASKAGLVSLKTKTDNLDVQPSELR